MKSLTEYLRQGSARTAFSKTHLQDIKLHKIVVKGKLFLDERPLSGTSDLSIKINPLLPLAGNCDLTFLRDSSWSFNGKNPMR